jgi:hypothetical protein
MLKPSAGWPPSADRHPLFRLVHAKNARESQAPRFDDGAQASAEKGIAIENGVRAPLCDSRARFDRN